MPGRRPKPTHLKVLAGNPGKRSLTPTPPEGAVGAVLTPGTPVMPEHLTSEAAAAWRRLAPELAGRGVLTRADGFALELLCEAYAEYRAARVALALHGTTYTTEGISGPMVRARPEVAIAADAFRRFARMLAEFGLTPAARGRAHGVKAEEHDPMDDLLGDGGA